MAQTQQKPLLWVLGQGEKRVRMGCAQNKKSQGVGLAKNFCLVLVLLYMCVRAHNTHSGAWHFYMPHMPS